MKTDFYEQIFDELKKAGYYSEATGMYSGSSEHFMDGAAKGREITLKESAAELSNALKRAEFAVDGRDKVFNDYCLLKKQLTIAQQEIAEWGKTLETQRDLNTAAFAKLTIAEKKLEKAVEQRDAWIRAAWNDDHAAAQIIYENDELTAINSKESGV